MSEIVRSLEEADLGVITEVEFDNGVWEVDTIKDGHWMELHVDPQTGQVLRRESKDGDDDIPPGEGMRLSSIIRSVEDQNLGRIVEVEFDDGYWEVEIRDGSRRIKLDIDPQTGREVDGHGNPERDTGAVDRRIEQRRKTAAAIERD